MFANLNQELHTFLKVTWIIAAVLAPIFTIIATTAHNYTPAGGLLIATAISTTFTFIANRHI